jgi:uncharacterized protein involved in type VI secretion and phage assembly
VSVRSRSTDRRFYGIAEAIVTDNDDPENEGRVKVRLPWFDEEMITEWCRVRQPYAGSGYGWYLVPEVGDEVLVAFIHGDLRLPVILGGLWNGKDKPSVHRGAGKDPKLLRTKKGHEILLDDSDGAEKIVIVDSGGKNRITLDVTGSSITVESTSGKLTLRGREVEIEAQQGIKVTAGGTLDLKGSTINLN